MALYNGIRPPHVIERCRELFNVSLTDREHDLLVANVRSVLEIVQHEYHLVPKAIYLDLVDQLFEVEEPEHTIHESLAELWTAVGSDTPVTDEAPVDEEEPL
jgi:hypothetical protein